MTDDERPGAPTSRRADAAARLTGSCCSAGDQVIGAYWGQQETWQRYYMVYSVVAPRLAGPRPLQGAAPRGCSQAATEAGFREIYSRHRADNNAILVPKLKAGFTIAAMEVAPRFGLLVHLRYYTGLGMRLLAEHRVDGAHAPALRERGLPIPSARRDQLATARPSIATAVRIMRATEAKAIAMIAAWARRDHPGDGSRPRPSVATGKGGVDGASQCASA
jgi:hypothetical protein